MTRDEMLEVLQNLPYVLIWPGNWEDVGFTEREIWVNSAGYGYIMCDEPTGHWKVPPIPEKDRMRINALVEDGSLTYDDIRDTIIEKLFDKVGLDKYSFDEEEFIDYIRELPILKKYCDCCYALQLDTGVEFFDNECAFRNAFEKTHADEEWESMDDELLSIWLGRLIKEHDPDIVEWANCNDLLGKLAL